MTPDTLNITADGLQALADADAGGILVAPKYFQVGDLSVSSAEDFYQSQGGIPTTITSNVVHTGNISYIQVVGAATVRFTIDIPEGIPVDSNTSDGIVPSVNIGELIIQDKDGTCLGHCVYSTPYVKRSNEGLRLEVLFSLTENKAALIDVTLSEYSGIPSVMSIDDLPSPIEAIANVVGVQDILVSPDGSTTPGIAQQFGAGGAHWSFTGHKRVFTGVLGDGNVTGPSGFECPEANDNTDFSDGELVIVQVITGAGAGQTRRFTAVPSGEIHRFTAYVDGFSDLEDASVVSIWQTTEASNGTIIPMSDVPSNYVLERGVSTPRWVPPLKASNNGSTLYHPPGELRVASYITAAEDSAGQRTFELYSKDLSQTTNEKAQIHKYSHTKNNNYAIIALGGINQHRDAFEITENTIEFSEDLPNETQVDARLFHLSPSTGALLNIRYAEYIADGSQTEFDIPVVGSEQITSPDQCLVYVDPFLQSINTYVIDVENQKIVFTSPPLQGLKVEVNALVTESVVGYATHIHTACYTTKDLTRIIQLPFAPSDKGLVFMSEQGMHVNRSLFDIVDDRLIVRRDIDANTEIEVMIFRNVLSEGNADTSISGVVTEAVVTSKSIELIRHNADRIRLPVPKFNIKAGDGIKVTGTFPEYTVTSTLSQQIAKDSPQLFNNQHRLDNAEEIIYTTRVTFKGDVTVKATADFSARLGPGFSSSEGLEAVQFVLGFKTHSINEPEYGRNIKGTGETGFSVTNPDKQGTYAYADKSISQSWSLKKANMPSGYIDVVAKMRVRNGSVSDYGSRLLVNLIVDVSPNLG